MLEECHQLDRKIASELSTIELSPNINKFGDNIRKIQEERHNDKIKISILKRGGVNQGACNITNKDYSELCNFMMYQGPIVQGIEKELYKHGIDIQSYHSRSMVGNHCVKYLDNYDEICQSVVSLTMSTLEPCKFSSEPAHINSIIGQAIIQNKDICS